MDAKVAVSRLLAMKPNAKGMTTREISKQIGRCQDRTNDFVKEAVNAGLCEYVGDRICKDIRGRPNPVPVYRFKKGKT